LEVSAPLQKQETKMTRQKLGVICTCFAAVLGIWADSGVAGLRRPRLKRLQGQPLLEWLEGFGFQGKITLKRSKATTPDGRKVRLPDASNTNYNASLSYEQYGLSLRASWQYRSDYLFEIGSADVGGDGYWQSVGRLDLSARYAISPRVEMFVDTTNLLDEPGRRYRGIPIRVLEFEKFGARFMGGVRINLGGSGKR